MNPAQFRAACDALGGQSETARALDLPARLVRHYCARDDIARAIPGELVPRVSKLLRARAKELQKLATTIETKKGN